MIKQVSSAAQADADVCNALSPPTKGCHAGSGIHVVIPADWQARIAAGQEVPGCSYAHIESDGSLFVDSVVNANIAIPAIVNALSVPLQAKAAALQTKLATAQVIST